MAGMGRTTVTYRFLLYHEDWMDKTKELYNRVLAFYFQLLLEKSELLELSNHRLLRELEILTVGTRQQKATETKPEMPLRDFSKLPLCFRRAAVNAAIGMVRSYVKRLEHWRQLGENERKGCPSPPARFMAAPLFYKGMYRNFEESSIELKLFTGSEWE